MLAENIFLLKTSFLGKFELFFSILNVNPTLVTMTAPKHLLNATEVTTCRNINISREDAKWPYIK